MHGQCNCDAAWTGESCSQLNLLAPEHVMAAYPPPDLIGNTTSWGGSVIHDSDTGIYHMFVAEMSQGCGLNSWTSNSQIAHATSASPEGPYTRRGLVAPPFAHNPTVMRAPDGTWVLYHIGCADGSPSQCTDCRGGVTGNCPSESETVSCTPGTTPGVTPKTAHVLYADAPEGPWQGLNVELQDIGQPPHMGKFGIDNPSPYVFPNGSVLMLGRCDYSTVGYIQADQWQGPYRLGSEVGNARSIGGVEDPFLYRDVRGHFHALFHGGHQGGSYKAAGAHAFSTDGITWSYSLSPAYITDISTADGQVHSYDRRERPHLIFDTNGFPTHLVTALTSGRGDNAFTFVQTVQNNGRSAVSV